MAKLFKLFLLILITVTFSAYADSLKVERFSERPMDIAARKADVRDLNKELCAMVRVALPVEGCKFEGNIIRSDYDVSEYLVYFTPGTKSFRIKCPGMTPLDVRFNEVSDIESVKSGMTYALDLSGYERLIAAGGQKKVNAGGNYLILDIIPKTDVFVKVDDMPQKVNNGQTSTFLKYGTHTYDIQAEGYAPEKGSVIIKEDDKTVVRLSLRSIHASLNITSDTPGSQISINNKDIGMVAFSGKVPPGTYLIEVSKEGYRPFSQTIELGESETKVVQVPALTPIYGALNVNSTPIDADVWIDDKKVGTTPGVFNNILVGSHRINLIKPGYDPYNSTVTITEGEVTSFEGELSGKKTGTTNWEALSIPYGELVVHVMPSNAEVRIDNELVGFTPGIFKVPIGSHSISISKSGYSSELRSLYINKGEKLNFDFNLKEIRREEGTSQLQNATSNEKNAPNQIEESSNQIEYTISGSRNGHDDEKKDRKVFMSCEVSPDFPDGTEALFQYLRQNVRYPDEALKTNKYGRVIVKFVVEADGSIGDAQVIKGVSPSLDKEAIRVVKGMPKWIPGKNNGEAVASWYKLPISIYPPPVDENR